ncbi:MAG: AraC family transcriptional regulator [Bacteroidales bacterium]|jgi:AraC-like DNA-binding protein|nr:AraC family transcriptional regulator [Bacteroidales bacterium]
MTTESSSKKIFKELSFLESGCSFFHGSFHKGNEENILGLEQFPHSIDAAGLCICLEGEGTVLIGGQSYRVQKDDMCVVLPGSILHIIEKSNDFKGYIFGFHSELLYQSNIPSATPLFMYIKENPCISLSEKEQDELIKICDVIQKHDFRKNHPYQKEISNHLVATVIYEVLGLYKEAKVLKQQPFSQKKIYYHKFIDLLNRRSGKNMTINFYANELCITPRYLSAICKEITGHTATESINKHILMNARLLLVSTNMTIAQISEELNFSNASFFSQFFKKYEGVMPKVYRENNRFEFNEKKILI